MSLILVNLTILMRGYGSLQCWPHFSAVLWWTWLKNCGVAKACDVQCFFVFDMWCMVKWKKFEDLDFQIQWKHFFSCDWLIDCLIVCLIDWFVFIGLHIKCFLDFFPMWLIFMWCCSVHLRFFAVLLCLRSFNIPLIDKLYNHPPRFLTTNPMSHNSWPQGK